MRIRALFPNLHPFSDLWNKHTGGCHFSQNEIGASSCGSRNILPLGLFPLGLRVLDAFLSFCRVEGLGEGFGCVDFARLLIS